MMRGVIVNKPGGAEQLDVALLPVPDRKEDELLVRVHAAAVNRTDILLREGTAGYLVNPLLGIEIAGTVVEASEGASFSIGDKMMGR
ncbi:Alcohol dehydrogenase GroES-like domain protein [compost metagenome]